MRSIVTSLMYTLLLSTCFAMSFSATDKKDEKKDKKDKGQKPVVIITYEPAWSPVTREISL